MIPLEEKYWKNFSSPYGDSSELPALLKKLDSNYTEELSNEVFWEYIYHQNTLYQSTIASLPYLFKIIMKEENKSIRLDAYISLGTILAELDDDEVYLKNILEDNKYKLDRYTKQDLYICFKESYKEFLSLLPNFIAEAKKLSEDEKRYFLAVVALYKNNSLIAKMLILFNGNDEYRSSCPNCDSEFYLWNEENRLNGYIEDPVFNKIQTPFEIIPKNIDRREATIQSDNYQEWMIAYIDLLEIDSLKEIITFLFGDTICPNCKVKYSIFPSVCNA